jgi:hypothetical protein
MPDRLTPERRAAVERWLVRRGIPHFIDRYSASQDVLTRAIPVLTLVFLFEMLGATKWGWSWWANVLAAAGGFAILLAAWAVANRLRDRPLLARPTRVGRVELAVFVFVPAVLPAIFGGQWDDAGWVVLGNLVLLAGVYVITSYGLVPMTRWAGIRLVRQLGDTLKLFTRGLPLLLVAFTFLFINAEVWQVAGTADDVTLAIVLALFVTLGMVFVVARLPRELGPMARFATVAEAEHLLAGTPAEGLHLEATDVPEPTRRQWGNAALVVLFTQMLRVVLAGAIVGLFFLVFGVMLIGNDIVASWTQGPVDVLATMTVSGRDHVVTAELIRVSLFLAGFSALYFTVYLTTDATFREEFFEDVAGEIHQAFAVRAAYLGAIEEEAA